VTLAKNGTHLLPRFPFPTFVFNMHICYITSGASLYLFHTSLFCMLSLSYFPSEEQITRPVRTRRILLMDRKYAEGVTSNKHIQNMIFNIQIITAHQTVGFEGNSRALCQLKRLYSVKSVLRRYSEGSSSTVSAGNNAPNVNNNYETI
jgi:hypothetical protein